MKSVVFVCNESNSVINFRKELIEFLKTKNIEISIITGDNIREKEIKSLGVNFACVPFSNRSKNPIEIIKTKKAFKKVIRGIDPDVVMTFQIKPNTVGVKAAHSAGIKNIYSMVEGLGDPFQPANLKGKLIRWIVCKLYKSSFKHVRKVFFLNNDDKEEFLNRKLIAEDKVIVIPGIGINTNNYKPDYNLPKEKKVLKLARLIKNKGIFDYCEIARLVHKTRPDIIFELYGGESQLTKKDIQQYIDDRSIIYGGFSKDTASLIKNTRLVSSSSSYREGFPRVILEGMALGRTVIATNIVGNKDAVVDGKTGYLVNVHDLQSFANKIIEIIDDDKKLVELGKNARKICEEKYDSSIINQIIYDTIMR